jgi:DNA polymerase-3 subunit epsilon
LCIKFCGLADSEAVCFNHQIKKCNGICANEEAAAVYNKRALEIIKKHSYKHPYFAIITEGRTSDEKSLMLIINNKYFGTGYFDEYAQLNSIADFKELVAKAAYYPDNDDLIRSWLKKNNPKMIVLK